MGKYRSSVVKRTTKQLNEPHFAWRGLGCLMMFIIPIISIAAGIVTIDYGLDHNWPIPYQLLGIPRYPELFYKSSGIMLILSPITMIKNFYAYATASFLYMVLFGGIISLIYGILYRVIAPSRYGPLDVPRPNIKVKRYKR